MDNFHLETFSLFFTKHIKMRKKNVWLNVQSKMATFLNGVSRSGNEILLINHLSKRFVVGMVIKHIKV